MSDTPAADPRAVRSPALLPESLDWDKEGGLLLNRNPIEKSKLAEEITRQLEFRDKRVVFVDFHEEVPYGDAVEIIDLAKKAGADVVGIMKDKDYKMPETLRGL